MLVWPMLRGSQLQAKIALRIKALLKEKGLSAERFAWEVGLSPGFLYHFLACERRGSLETLETIAKGLGIKVKDLFPD